MQIRPASESFPTQSACAKSAVNAKFRRCRIHFMHHKNSALLSAFLCMRFPAMLAAACFWTGFVGEPSVFSMSFELAISCIVCGILTRKMFPIATDAMSIINTSPFGIKSVCENRAHRHYHHSRCGYQFKSLESNDPIEFLFRRFLTIFLCIAETKIINVGKIICKPKK